MRKKATIQSLLWLAALAGLAGATSAQITEGEHVAHVRELYGVDGWQLGALRDGLTLGSVELPGLLGGELRVKDGLVERAFTPAGAPDGAPPALVVQALVADGVEAAQDQLVGWLAGLTSPQAAPTAASVGVPLGQAGYVGPSGAGPHATSWVAFVEGNVAVRLLNADVERNAALQLPRLAAAIDAGIRARKPLAVGARVPRPEIAELAIETGVAAGRAVPVAVDVVDPLDGAATLAWDVSGDGQGYVERRGDGWVFFPTGVGHVTITLTAIGSNGTTSTTRAAISVLHD